MYQRGSFTARLCTARSYCTPIYQHDHKYQLSGKNKSYGHAARGRLLQFPLRLNYAMTSHNMQVLFWVMNKNLWVGCQMESLKVQICALFWKSHNSESSLTLMYGWKMSIIWWPSKPNFVHFRAMAVSHMTSFNRIVWKKLFKENFYYPRCSWSHDQGWLERNNQILALVVVGHLTNCNKHNHMEQLKTFSNLVLV